MNPAIVLGPGQEVAVGQPRLKGGPKAGIEEVLFVECFRFCVSLVPGSALLDMMIPESVSSAWP